MSRLAEIRSRDAFGELVDKEFRARREPKGDGNWASRPSRMPGRRGPVKQFTDSVDAPVTADVAKRLRTVARRRGISLAGLLRQIFDAWLKENEEAWR